MKAIFACACGAVYVASGPRVGQMVARLRRLHLEEDPTCREVTLAEARKARQKAEKGHE